jgi:hypothetical protein
MDLLIEFRGIPPMRQKKAHGWGTQNLWHPTLGAKTKTR